MSKAGQVLDPGLALGYRGMKEQVLALLGCTAESSCFQEAVTRGGGEDKDRRWTCESGGEETVWQLEEDDIGVCPIYREEGAQARGSSGSDLRPGGAIGVNGVPEDGRKGFVHRGSTKVVWRASTSAGRGEVLAD